MNRIILRLGAGMAVLLLLGFSINAQNRDDVYAITNAEIQTVADGRIEGGTVLIRDGLIVEVGKSVAIPADARVLDGTGLTVYPGLIDTYTDLGIPKTSGSQQGRSGSTGGSSTSESGKTSTNYPEGLRPEEMAYEQLKTTEAQFEKQRNNGITTVVSVGTDGIFNGQSAVLNLAGETLPAMVLRPVFAQHITFRTLRGGQYPTSLMGTFSALRQMFLDARRLQEWRKMYAENPRGIRRPETDQSLEALIPVVNGQIPVAFNANTEREIIRALDLAKEFDLKAIIVGGQEAWKVADRLKEHDVPVLLSLDFPKRTLSENKEADPETLEVLRLREEVPKNAARLKNAGVRFAFQSGSMKDLKDFLANAAVAVENGLSKENALRALTLSAAEILGIDRQLGSIEKGKIANLVVTRGEMFDEKSKFTHIFVDGKLFEQKEPPKKEKTDGGDQPTGGLIRIGGRWDVQIAVPGQTINATFDLTQQEELLTGTMITEFGTTEITDGKVTAEGFSFSARVDPGGGEMEIFVSGKLTGSEIEGTITTPQGAVGFSGTKIP